MSQPAAVSDWNYLSEVESTSSSYSSTPAPIPAHLVGCWKLISFAVRRTPTSEPEEFFGKTPVGLIIYCASGEFSIQFSKPDRPHFAHPVAAYASPDEWQAAGVGHVAYCGLMQYFPHSSSNPSLARIIHHTFASLNPNWNLTQQERFASFSEDFRFFTMQPAAKANEVPAMLVWERIDTSNTNPVNDTSAPSFVSEGAMKLMKQTAEQEKLKKEANKQ